MQTHTSSKNSSTKKLRTLFQLVKKNISTVTLGILLIAGLLTYTVSPFSYTVGNLFFGSVPQLYNVTFAQFFFQRATHPLVGTPCPFAFHQLSRTHFIQGNLEKSLTYAKQELTLYPEHKATYYVMGLTYGYLNQEADAINTFREYLEYKPTSWAGRNDMAWLQFRTGDIVGALDTINPAYDMYPNNPWVLNTYGVILMNLGVYDEAKRVLELGSTISMNMTEDEWGRAYPGNNPAVYKSGLSAMRESFKDNLTLLAEKIPHVDKNKN